MRKRTMPMLVILGGCLGTGHVFRGVHEQAVVDLDCPTDKVEVESLDRMNERFRATGCDRVGLYDWVEGKPVLDGPVRDAKSQSDEGQSDEGGSGSEAPE